MSEEPTVARDLLDDALNADNCALLHLVNVDELDYEYDEDLLRRLLLHNHQCFREWAWENLPHLYAYALFVAIPEQDDDLWAEIAKHTSQDDLESFVHEWVLNDNPYDPQWFAKTGLQQYLPREA